MGNDSSKSQGGSKSSKASALHSSVQRHIETARKSRVLQLRDSGLKNLPQQLEELTDIVRHVELSMNKLKSLPPMVGDFKCIKQLHATDNQIESIPDEIGQLKTLEVLDVSGNKLKQIPTTLSACFALRILNLSNNSIHIFPRAACDLPNLDMVDLSQNLIECIPDEVQYIHANEINLNQNRLASINAPALIKCARLKFLRIEENCLKKEEFTKELLEDSKLAIIAYRGNLFQDKDFNYLPGYESYQERYTATRRKM